MKSIQKAFFGTMSSCLKKNIYLFSISVLSFLLQIFLFRQDFPIKSCVLHVYTYSEDTGKKRLKKYYPIYIYDGK